MDRADRRIKRWPAIAVAVLLGLAAAVWAILPNGGAARVERVAGCHDPSAQPKAQTLADGRRAVRLRVLLWNVEGLPWPIRSGRDAKLARMADWIAQRRAAGLGPDILILHKAFTPAASRIALAGDFRSVLPGPARDHARHLPTAAAPAGFAAAADWRKGEGLGKWLDGGLYIATDLPVLARFQLPFGAASCAGYDCLANKGSQAAIVAIPGAPDVLRIFNTHRNAREPSGVSIARAETAHKLQTEENDLILQVIRADGGAMIAAGDFNNYRAGDRRGFFADDPGFRLAAKGDGRTARAAAITDRKAWDDAYDLVGYRSSDTLRVEPLAVASLFDGKNGPRLSDHDAQYIVFRISWAADARPAPVAVKSCPA